MFKTMNSSYLREIPLRILNRKIGDEHVTLLQACYDNPIFHEEDGKRVPQQNGGAATEKAPGNPDYHGVEACNNSHDPRGRAFSGGHAASEYMHSLPPTSPASNDVTFRGHRKRKRRCLLCTACAIVALVVGLGILIYLLEEGDQSSDTQITSSAIVLSKVEINMTVREGPFSQYMLDYSAVYTDASILLRRAIAYTISDIFSSSDLSYLYNKTEKVRISNSNGSVTLTLIIVAPPHVTCTAQCEDRITATLIRGLEHSSFGVDKDSVSAKIYGEPVASPSVAPPKKQSRCLPMTYKECPNHSGYYSVTNNGWGQLPQQDAISNLRKYRRVLSIQCFDYARQFYCGAFFPECSSNGKPAVLPCKRFCEDVRSACERDYQRYNISFPFPNCTHFEDSEDSTKCTLTPFVPGKCIANARLECHLYGFNRTTFPTPLDKERVDRHGTFVLELYARIQAATHCYKHSMLFACSILTPKCSGKAPPHHYIPPCKSLCQEYKNRCEIFGDVFNNHWPPNLVCSELPDSPDTSVCVGYREAREPDDTACYKGQIPCVGDKDVCIDKDWLCDGIQDCPSNSDEKNCASCGPNQDQCSSQTAVCIGKDQSCDGINHCYGETDETFCVRLDPSIENNHLLVRNPEKDNQWEEVCETDWTNDFSNMTCRQLGYKQSLATYFTSQSNSSMKSIVNTFTKNGSDPNRLQSYLQKGQTSCSTGRVVQLLCWKAVCGSRPAYVSSPLRVLGGDEVRPGTWPWMVSLHGGTGESFFCGGSIIEDQWILTAAHCVGWADRETSYWTIKAGDTRREVYSEYRQVRKPEKLYRHQDFVYLTVENDVALIKLKHPLKLNDYVRAICLPERGTDRGTRCMATGWGKSTEMAIYYEKALRQVTVDVMSWSHCYGAFLRTEHKAPYELKKSMFCAGGTKAHDSCSGDSGGPLACRKPNTTDGWYQSGVVSWGIHCGLPNVPGVYSNLTLYLDWIRDVIANNTKNTGKSSTMKLPGQ